MGIISLIAAIISLILILLTIVVVYKKIKSVYVNLYSMSKGLDILWENQKKIIELTKIKGFVQLTKEEEQYVKTEITEEKQKLGNKKTKEPVRSSDSNSDDKKS